MGSGVYESDPDEDFTLNLVDMEQVSEIQF